MVTNRYPSTGTQQSTRAGAKPTARHTMVNPSGAVVKVNVKVEPDPGHTYLVSKTKRTNPAGTRPRQVVFVEFKEVESDRGRPGLVISPDSPLTNALIAQAVGVARSQPTRWLSNEETPSPQSQARLADLYNVAAQFQMVWPAAMLPQWFESANAHLAGRKPIEVFRLEGGAPLLQALRADGAGAYA